MPGDEADADPATVIPRTRERVAQLAVEDGTFYVACVETGGSPEPVTDATVPSHDAAAAAADATRRYRDAHEGSDRSVGVTSSRERDAGTRANGLPRSRRVATVSGGGEGEWLRVENAPVVFLSRDANPLDVEAVERQLDSKR
jgi:hypothetical protein